MKKMGQGRKKNEHHFQWQFYQLTVPQVNLSEVRFRSWTEDRYEMGKNKIWKKPFLHSLSPASDVNSFL